MTDRPRGLLDFFGLGGDAGADYGDPYADQRAAQRAALQQKYEQTQQQRYGINRPRVNPDDPFYADRSHVRQELQYQDQERGMMSPGTPSRVDEILSGLTKDPEQAPQWVQDMIADRLWRKPQKDPNDRTRRGFGY